MTIFCTSKEFQALARDLNGKADTIRLQVKGGSMFPFIRSGEWVEAALPGSRMFNVIMGDVVIFSIDGSLYAHRVIKLDGESMVSMGDLSLGADGIIPLENVIARVVAIERNGRRVDITAGIFRIISLFIARYSFLARHSNKLFRKLAGIFARSLACAQGFRFYRKTMSGILGSDVIIRESVPEDAEDLRDIYVMAGLDIKKDISAIKSEGFWLVAEDKGKLRASLTITRSESDPSLWLIFGLEVKPLSRGLGIGQKLVSAAIARASDNGAARVGLIVKRRSIPAIRLYAKLKFIQFHPIPPGLNCMPDELYMQVLI